MHGIDEKAEKAKDKKAALGPDIDLTSSRRPVPHTIRCRISNNFRLRTRSGSSWPDWIPGRPGDPAPISRRTRRYSLPQSRRKGLRSSPSERPWSRRVDQGLLLEARLCRRGQVHAKAELNLHDGYVIRALPGSKVDLPGSGLPLSGQGRPQPERPQHHHRRGRFGAPHHHGLLHVPSYEKRPPRGDLRVLRQEERQAQLHHDPQLGRRHDGPAPVRGHGRRRRACSSTTTSA